MQIIFSESEDFSIDAFDRDRERIVLHQFGDDELRAILAAPLA
jgi:hypothetical protein